jgi:hypothetical protein
MTTIMLPAVINDRPNKRMVRGFGEIKMLGIAVKIARNIHMRCTLAEAQNWKCCWCGTHCIPEPGHSNSATIEHVTPRSLGGSDEWENLAMACAHCNHRRGVLSIEDFMNGVTPPVKKKDKEARAERVIAKKVRKYERHIARFNQHGWQRDGREYCPHTWLDTLRLPEKYLNQLKEMIEA